jgi:hypothetical protein
MGWATGEPCLAWAVRRVCCSGGHGEEEVEQDEQEQPQHKIRIRTWGPQRHGGVSTGSAPHRDAVSVAPTPLLSQQQLPRAPSPVHALSGRLHNPHSQHRLC